MGSCHAGHAARVRRVATPSKKWERARKKDNLDQTAHVLAVRKGTMRRGSKGAPSKERERYNCGHKDTRRARTNETVQLGTPLLVLIFEPYSNLALFGKPPEAF